MWVLVVVTVAFLSQGTLLNKDAHVVFQEFTTEERCNVGKNLLSSSGIRAYCIVK